MIYVVRHGQTDWNVAHRNQGRTDIPLNETGINQAKQVAESLSDINFDVIFCSPLSRAKQTAEIICPHKIICDNRIMERSNGDMEGKILSEVPDAPDFTDPNETRYNIEPLNEFCERIKNFLDEITRNYKEQNVLIVTHAGISIYIKCYFFGEPIDKNYSGMKLKNCEILEINND